MALQWLIPALAFVLVIYCIAAPSRVSADKSSEDGDVEALHDPPRRAAWKSAILWILASVAAAILVMALAGIKW